MADRERQLLESERREFREWVEEERADVRERLRERIRDRRRETEREMEEIRQRFGEADRLSAKGAEFIADHEGVVLHGYDDPVGHCTIGVGHLIHHGNCSAAELARTITREQAFNMLRRDARVYTAVVLKLIDPELKQHQLDALVSFTYNNGVGSLEDSTLRRRLNAGEPLNRVVEQELPRWVQAGTPPHPLEGLKNRRQAEIRLFTTGRYK